MSEERPVYFPPVKPDVQALLASPSSSVWLKVALQSALERDPVEAARDAELLAEVLSGRVGAALRTRLAGG
jgi:hypothetical protein